MCIADGQRVNGSVCIVLFECNDNSTRPAMQEKLAMPVCQTELMSVQ